MQVVYSRACSLVREVGRARLFRFSSPFSPRHTLRSRQAFLKVRPHFFFPPIVFSFCLSSSAREAAICLTVWFGLYIAREGARGLPQPIPLIQPNFAYHTFTFVHNHLRLHFALVCGSSPCMSLPSFRPSICPYGHHIVGCCAFFDLIETHLIPLQFTFVLSVLPSNHSRRRRHIQCSMFNVHISSCLCYTHPYRIVSYLHYITIVVCCHFDLGLAYSNHSPAHPRHSVLQCF